MTDNNSISIIIPCYNEEKYISDCLKGIIEGNYPLELIEVLVVDGFSEDETRTIVNNYCQYYSFIKLIDNKKRKTPFALNIGIENASNELILILSAHSKMSTDYLEKLVFYINKLQSDVVGGKLITNVKNKTKKALSITKVLSNKFGVGNSMFRIGSKNPIRVDTVPFGLYKKEIFNEVGLYNTRLIRNHDIELSKRLIANNKSIYLIPEVSCIYYARETYKKLAENNYKNGLWNVLTLYITKNFESLSIRHYIPLIFLLSLIVPIIISAFISKWILLIAVISFIFYNTALFFISLKIRDKKTSFFYLVFSFYTLHFSYSVGSLFGLFHLNKLFFYAKRKI